jgi:hypothetical protein
MGDKKKGKAEGDVAQEELPEAARARIKAAAAKAKLQLGHNITVFFEKCREPEFITHQLHHKPSGADLIPFFQAYAAEVFDAECKEYLQGTSDESRYRQVLKGIASRVLNHVAQSLWQPMVLHSAERVHMADWLPNAPCEMDDFLRSKPVAIRGTLRQCATKWSASYWEARAAELSKPILHQPVSTASPNDTQVSPLKAWLQEQLAKKRWTKADLIRESGVNRKTIKRIYVNDQPPRADTIDKLAHAFGVHADHLEGLERQRR